MVRRRKPWIRFAAALLLMSSSAAWGEPGQVDNIREAFGALEPINAAYRHPDARVELMDKQRLAGCFLFPTLGVGVEEALLHDPDALHAVFHGFNEWMHDDWTFNFRDRMFFERSIQEDDLLCERPLG